MLTRLSRSGCGLVYGFLMLAACSLDSRTLSPSSADHEPGAGGRGSEELPSFAGSNAVGTAGDDSTSNPGGAASDADAGGDDPEQPSSSPSCNGDAPQRRCAVSGGSFQLGPPDVGIPSTITSFQLDELEVTVARFRRYVTNYSGAPMADAGAHPQIPNSGWRSAWNSLLPATKEALIAGLHCNADWETWTDSAAEREDYPLTCASYYVAFAFCAESGGRLPTEAEWEYAARGGAQQRRYPWGNQEPTLELALFDTSSLAPAGKHQAGMARFGQLDLAGSAWEWTLDYFREYPVDCQQCAEVERGSERVLRGGAFLYGAEYLEPSYRYHQDPQLALGDVGFRCAYER